jgi:asparagine synthase (glutamine-hydrolysing)
MLVDKPYYQIPQTYRRWTANQLSYDKVQQKLVELLDESVRKRLIADVPLGAFLSGGIDSSVIVALASQYTSHLNTFSVGYRDEPFFDETKYANLVAKKYKTNHTVFSLYNDDLYTNTCSTCWIIRMSLLPILRRWLYIFSANVPVKK